jgi:hypothetical protein
MSTIHEQAQAMRREGLERLNKDMRVADPEMSILAHKAAMFDELLNAFSIALSRLDVSQIGTLDEVYNRASKLVQK